MATSRRAALYVRISTSDRGQTVENQLQPLHEAAGRLGWTVVTIYRDEGISGSLGRQKRPGLDALLKGVASARVRHRGRMVGVPAETIPVRPDRPARRATIPRHRSLPAPAGARYLDAIGQDAVRDAGRVLRV